MAYRHLETSIHGLHQSWFLRRPEVKLLVLRVIRLLKASLSNRSSRFFRYRRCIKCVHMAFRHLETSHHCIQKFFFLRRSESRLRVLRAIRLPKTSLQRLRPSRFIPCPGCTKWVRMYFRHIETSIRRIHQSRFFNVQKADYEFSGQFTYLKHHLSDMARHFFRCSVCGKWVRMAFGHLQIWLHLLHQSLFLWRWKFIIS
jgi:hypothetical protein